MEKYLKHTKESKNKCLNKECLKYPSFNYKGKKGKYCFDHKKENMINVKSRKCLECDKIPSFNYSTKLTPDYCKDHKKSEMINIMNKRCNYNFCFKKRIFNYENEKSPKFCNDHKKENMINILKKNKKCIIFDCNNISYFNYINKKPEYCILHFKDNMIITRKIFNKCSNYLCINKSIYNYSNQIKSKYCEEHKRRNMIKIEKDKIIENKKDKIDLCKYCDIDFSIENVCDRCLKIKNKKEFMIVREIKKNIKNKFIHNKANVLDVKCSDYKRPDIIFELSTYFVIVEIDENQHKNYKCELKRINRIANGCFGKSLIIIRFNPDKFKINKKIQNILIVERLEKLISTIKLELEKDYKEFFVKEIKLFYDNKIFDENIITDKVTI